MTRLHLCARFYPHTHAHTNPMQLKASRTWPAAPNKAPADLDCSVCRVTSICFPVTLRVFVRSGCARKGWQRLHECVRVHPACARASRRGSATSWNLLLGFESLRRKTAGLVSNSSVFGMQDRDWAGETSNSLIWKKKRKQRL